MSRYTNVLRTALSQQEAQGIISAYLESAGFKYRQEAQEMVWRKGVGWLAAPQFMKAEAATDGTVRIESWMAQFALLPGVYFGEMDPTQGVYGFAVKAFLKQNITELEGRLGGQSVASAAPKAGWYSDPTGRHQQRYWDGSRWTENVADNGQGSVDSEGAA